MRLTQAALLSLAVAPLAHAAISLDVAPGGQTYWGDVNFLAYLDNSPYYANGADFYYGQHLYSVNPVVVGPPQGGVATMSQGTRFLTLMQSTNAPAAFTASSELAGSNLAAGATVHLAYNGLTARPSYVAVMGGEIQSYAYDPAAGRLTIVAKTGALAPTASNPGTLSEALAIAIETDPNYDFGGSVFRTNAYWATWGT